MLTPKRGINIKKAPGFIPDDYDIGHYISLPFKDGWSSDLVGPVKMIPTVGSMVCN